MSGPPSAKALFLEALELAPAARAVYLERACGADADLRARVKGLLEVYESAGPFLGAPTAVAPRAGALAEAPGTTIGRYKLLQLIGEGGFGSVFMAEQTEPVARRVALKIIKLGMDTRQVIARFEAERQALAMMDHPNIARVLDAGTTETGRPYFVMELVKGEPVTAYCDKNSLTIRERLDLFAQVCHAVQHAHTKGVIHRDLKPGNVLVSTQDGRPHAKIIDFGIAKATDRRLTEKTLFTEMRQLVGTPEYMSPEQAEGSLDIDTRTDVYSLGVLLYELLTGATPFDPMRLRSAAYAEIQRIIREEEPEKPSTRLSHSAGALPGVAAQRRVEPARLGALVRGDLDCVVMKCLEKDRSRRYETASGLAADILRHLAGESVAAVPPSAAYKVRKFVRRHRVGVLASAAIVASLILGVLGTSVGLVRATWERDRVEAQRARATAALGSVARTLERRVEESEWVIGHPQEDSRAPIETTTGDSIDALGGAAVDLVQRLGEARQSEARTAAFMVETLKGVGPSVARGRDVALLREMMDGAAERITRGDLKDAPEAELRLRLVIGHTYYDLAEYTAATAMLDTTVALARSLSSGRDSDALARAMNETAELLRGMGRVHEAEPMHQQALEMRQRLFRGDHPDVAMSLNNLAGSRRALGRAKDAETLFARALEMRQRLYEGDHPDVAYSLNNLAFVRQELGRPEDAQPLYEQALEMRRSLFSGDHPDIAMSLNNLGAIRRDLGRPAEAEPLFEQALEMRQRLFKGDHPDVALSMNILAGLRRDLGRAAEAEPLFERALEMRRRLFPGDHSDTARSLSSLGLVRQALGRHAEAETLYRQALEMNRRLFTGDHPEVATSLNNLGLACRDLGRLHEAEPLLREGLDMRQKLYTGDHVVVATSLNNFALVRRDLGHAAEAEPLFEQALQMRQRLFKGDHQHVAVSLNNLGYVRQLLGRHAEAEPLYLQALEMRQRLYKGDHPEVATSLNNVGVVRRDLGRPADAEAPVRESLEMRRRLFKGDHPDVAMSLYSLATVLHALARWADAETLHRQALEMRQRLFKGDHPDVARSLHNLADEPLALGRIAEAEGLYRQALEMRLRSSVGDHVDVARNLIDLSCALDMLGRGDEARRFRAEALAMGRRLFPEDSPGLAATLARGGQSLLKVGTPEAAAEAEPILRECLRIRAKVFPAGHEQRWMTNQTMSLLGQALAAQGRYADAEPLLLEGYSGLRDGPGTPRPGPWAPGADAAHGALQRIVELYNAWDAAEPGKGHDAKAAEWRRRLEEYNSARVAPDHPPR